MLTPDDFSRKIVRTCAAKRCSNAARDGFRYCSAHRRAETWNARTSLSRLTNLHALIAPGESDRIESDRIKMERESLPESPGLRIAAISEKLDRSEALLISHGPGSSKEHWQAMEIAKAAGLVLLTEDGSRDRDMLTARCFEILRDFGTLRPLDISAPLQWGWAAFCMYRRYRDYRHMAKSLNAYAIIWRLFDREDLTTRMIHWGLNLLRGYFNEKDPYIADVLHNTLSWNLRLRQDQYRSGVELDRDVALFKKLADNIAIPSVMVDTHRVLGIYWTSQNKPTLAFEEFRQMDELCRQHDLPVYANSSLQRAKIQALLKAGSPEDIVEAGTRIETEYLPGYKSDRHLWSYKTINDWILIPKLNLSARLDEPEYFSSDLTFLPRQQKKAA